MSTEKEGAQVRLAKQLRIPIALAGCAVLGAWLWSIESHPTAARAEQRAPQVELPAALVVALPTAAPAANSSPAEAIAKAPTEPAAFAPPLEEPALMQRLHELGETDPATTLSLARLGNERYPGSADAPERAWILVKSLVNLQRFAEARAAAAVMVDTYRDTTYAEDINRHLLSNPP